MHLLVFCKCWSSRIVKSLFKYGWWCGHNLISVKVEKILKGSLDSIPSPSSLVKIQIMGGKVCWRCKGKTLLGNVKKVLKTKCWHHPTVFFLITSSKLSCQWFEFSLKMKVMDWIKAIFLDIFYFMRKMYTLQKD